MCTEAEKSGELCCKSAGRMVNILSNQLKRRFLVPDDGNELTMLQRHMLHFIIVGSMHQDIFQKDVRSFRFGNPQPQGFSSFWRRRALSAGRA